MIALEETNAQNTHQMKDIYLSYMQETFHLAQHLKDDIESNTNLLVALETDDWEEDEGHDSGEFQEHLHNAKHVLVLLTKSGNITAWIMDPNITEIQPGFQRARDISLPPQIDFTESFDKGLDTFRYILKVVTGSGDVEMDPEHAKIATKEERTVSSTHSSGRREEQTTATKRPRSGPKKGFTSPVKKFQLMMRKLNSKKDQPVLNDDSSTMTGKMEWSTTDCSLVEQQNAI